MLNLLRTGFVFILFGISTGVVGQQVTINPGVDTLDKNINAVVTLWKGYLASKPGRDNLKDNPFWADSENKLYPLVDQLCYAVSTEIPVYEMGNPTILSITPKNEGYEIKTLFSWADNAGKIYASSIISVFAQKEGSSYKLYNALSVNSKRWKTKRFGDIIYHFPAYHKFSSKDAATLRVHIEELRKQWQLAAIPVNYYFAETFEEVQQLRGLVFAMGMGNAQKPSGMAEPANNIVYAGGLGENYFHEIVHIYLNKLFPTSPLIEGLAVFYGGSLGHDLQWHLAKLADYLSQHPEIKLNELENFTYLDNTTNPNSTIQGLLCYLAYKKGGVNALKQLMLYSDIYIAVEAVFAVKKDKLDGWLREQLLLNRQ